MMRVRLPDFDNLPAGGKQQTLSFSFRLAAGVTLSASGPSPLAVTIGTVPAQSTGTDPSPQNRLKTDATLGAPVTNADGTTQQTVSFAGGGWVGGVTYLFTLTFNLSTGDDAKIFNHAYCVAPN